MPFKVSSDNEDYDLRKFSFDFNNQRSTREMRDGELWLFVRGNVYEWCNDWYGKYNSRAQTYSTGPTTGTFRVLRGGSWSHYATYCRCADRNFSTPSYRNHNLGVRLAL